MLSTSSSPFQLCLIAAITLAGATATQPYSVPWSTTTFGPDGPWQGVVVSVGSPAQKITLYPGGQFQSGLLTADICSNTTLSNVCYATGGFYDESASSTAVTGKISFGSGFDVTDGGIRMGGTPGTSIMDQISFSGATVPNVSIAEHNSLYMIYPSGQDYPVHLGSLGLGSQGTVNQTFTESPPTPNINASLIPGYMYAIQNTIPSNSFGLHIGSANLKMTGSLYFGGYDQVRVAGNISTQTMTNSAIVIDLLDIGISVFAGYTPFKFSSMSGLLAANNKTIGVALPVMINPLNPYLHLPGSTCDAIAARLPVTYSPDYGLYFWNTSDPNYKNIVSSASGLSFIFRKDQSSGQTVTINVPFTLLNLTLQAPLTATPTPYFPCYSDSRGNYQLGRAFLQAAFFGANWQVHTATGDSNAAVWWLAQAPGPNIPSQGKPVALQNNDTSIQATSDNWVDSWNAVWTPLSSPSATSASTSKGTQATATTTTSASSASNLPTSAAPNPSGLGTGAIVGIVLGGVAALIGLIVAAVLLARRRRSRRDIYPPPNEMPGEPTKVEMAADGGPMIAYSAKAPDYINFGDFRTPTEVVPHFEMDGSAVHELGSSS